VLALISWQEFLLPAPARFNRWRLPAQAGNKSVGDNIFLKSALRWSLVFHIYTNLTLCIKTPELSLLRMRPAFDHFSFTIGQKSKLSLAGSLKPRCQTGEENPRARLNLSE
tara:strand:- start:68 stop:400 length:333 start_codon:yes stop_codon:yes gene_type:complete